MTSTIKPWLKWYPTDWRADPALRMCSLAARGLWIELLGYMHEAEPYGHLVINGRAPTEAQIAVLVGADIRTVKAALAELESAGVFSRDNVGRAFSRRMCRDKARAEIDRANGKTGGNPALIDPDKPPDNPTGGSGDNGGVNPPHKAQRPEARSQRPETPQGTVVPEREVAGAGAPQPSGKRGSRLPDDWEIPPAWAEWAQRSRRWTAEQTAFVALKFRNHWTAATVDATRRSWERTWQNWVLRERDPMVAPAHREQTLAERRANTLDAVINGATRHERTIEGDAERVGGAAVPALPVDLRKPG